MAKGVIAEPVAPAPGDDSEESPNRRRARETVFVRVDMTPTEHSQASKELAGELKRLEERQEEIKEELREKKAEWADELGTIQANIKRLRPDVLESRKSIQRDCIITTDFEKGVKECRDAETGKLYESKDLDENENQVLLFT